MLLRVLLAEGVGEALNLHAQNDELVDGDFLAVRCVVDGNQKLHELLRKPESHLGQRLHQLLLFDGTALIAIVSLETVQPLIYVIEELLELVDVDGSAAIGIEHGNHQCASLIGEIRSFAIHQRRLKLLRVDLSASVFIDLAKKVLHIGTDGGLLWLTGVSAGITRIVALKSQSDKIRNRRDKICKMFAGC